MIFLAAMAAAAAPRQGRHLRRLPLCPHLSEAALATFHTDAAVVDVMAHELRPLLHPRAVLGGESSQRDAFVECAMPLLEAALGGQHYAMLQRDRATGYPLCEGLVSKEPTEALAAFEEMNAGELRSI